SGPDNGAVAVL
nr:Chain C, Epitope from Neuraminidase Protein (NA-181-191) [Influenza A virus]